MNEQNENQNADANAKANDASPDAESICLAHSLIIARINAGLSDPKTTPVTPAMRGHYLTCRPEWSKERYVWECGCEVCSRRMV